ncbi:MAG: transcription elongation factor GreA [Nitrospinae bacterium]|nr:transcription elongation factor GreA [Nitrospinota bacterium]
MRLPILDKLDKDLMACKKELEVDIPKALKEAIALGDLSENAEYKSAKERQMFLESRISQLQKRIGDIASLNINQIAKDKSGLGSTLFLKDIETGEARTYKLVFPEEVDPDEGKISLASPLGKALFGKRKGDEVVISIQGGRKEYEVVQMTTIHEDTGESGL